MKAFFYIQFLISGCKKTPYFFKCLIRKVQVQGLPFLKIKEFTFVNDCFQKGRNAEIGLFVQVLIIAFLMFSCKEESQFDKIDKLTIIHVKGCANKQGFQHGKTLQKEITKTITEWKETIEEQSGKPFPKARNAFFSHTHYVKHMEQVYPEILEEIKGVAEGSRIEYETILAFQMGEEMDMFFNKRSKKCTAISIDKHDDQPTIVAQNMDPPPHLHGYPTLLHVTNETGTEAYIYTVPGLIGLNGLNNHGIAITCNSISMLNSSKEGLPVACIVRKTLEQKTGNEAFAIIKKTRHAIPQSYIVGCPELAKCFECSSDTVAEYKTFPDKGIILHSNFSIKNRDFNQPFIDLLAQYGKTVNDPYFCPRFYLAYDKIVAKKHNLNEDSIAAILSLNKPEIDPISNKGTYGSLIMTLGKKPQLLIAPDRPDSSAYIKLTFHGQ